MVYFAEYLSPVGTLLLLSDGAELTGLFMDRTPPPQGIREETLPVLRQTQLWLDAYFRGEGDGTLPPIKLAGTPFQRLIWTLLLDIPYGRTCTYGDLARSAAARLGKERMSAQAVGNAVGRNPIGILIPCHRVLGSDGSLTGYAWGIEKKAWLLRHEGWGGEYYDGK